MPFSCFHHCNAGLSFSSRKPHGRAIYEAIVSNLGRPGETLSTEEGSRMRAWAFATAMQHARARYALETGVNQADPRLLSEPFIPEREFVYGIVPGPKDSPEDRRRAIAAAVLARYGASYLAARAAFVALLGHNFRGYRVTKPNEATMYPALGDMSTSKEHNFLARNGKRIPKFFRLLDPVLVNLGSPQWVRYELLGLPKLSFPPGANPPPLDVIARETYTVDPGLRTRHERIEILETDPGDENNAPRILAVFEKPHTPGVLVSSMNYPFWTSTKRHINIVVKEAAAKDHEIRTKALRLARKVVPGTTTFAVVQEDPNNPRHTGVYMPETSWPNIQTMGDVELIPLASDVAPLPEPFGDKPPVLPP